MRWLLDQLKEVGDNTKVLDILFSTAIKMVPSVTITKGGSNNLKRYPFHLLFRSKASMNEFLKNRLNYSDKDVKRFNNLYFTPFFHLCVHDAVGFMLSTMSFFDLGT
jgi:hypothetical protein